MLPHWTERIADLRPRFVRAPRLLIASDFDGTLAPFVDHPSTAALHPAAQSVLESLSALHPRVRLAFLSGRSLADLAARLPINQNEIILAGNHGLELRGAGLDWTHPVSEVCRPHLVALAKELHQAVDGIVGAEIEDKGASLTLHFRRVAPADVPGLHSAVDSIGLPEGIQRHEGKKVIELRPQVDWNKGRALRRILERLEIPPAATIYLGDDVTDEDAFGELSGTGVTLRVGSRTDTSLAAMHAHDPEDAIEFLKAVAASLRES